MEVRLKCKVSLTTRPKGIRHKGKKHLYTKKIEKPKIGRLMLILRVQKYPYPLHADLALEDEECS